MEIFLFMVCDSWYWPCPMQGFCHFNFLTRSFGKWQSSLHIEGLCGGHFTTSCLCGRFLFGLPHPSLQFFERCETSQSCSLSPFTSVELAYSAGVTLSVSLWTFGGSGSKVEVLEGGFSLGAGFYKVSGWASCTVCESVLYEMEARGHWGYPLAQSGFPP